MTTIRAFSAYYGCIWQWFLRSRGTLAGKKQQVHDNEQHGCDC